MTKWTQEWDVLMTVIFASLASVCSMVCWMTEHSLMIEFGIVSAVWWAAAIVVAAIRELRMKLDLLMAHNPPPLARLYVCARCREKNMTNGGSAA